VTNISRSFAGSLEVSYDGEATSEAANAGCRGKSRPVAYRATSVVRSGFEVLCTFLNVADGEARQAWKQDGTRDVIRSSQADCQLL
jgi:hypothetical protein